MPNAWPLWRGAAVGVLEWAALGNHAIGNALATAEKPKTKHAVKQVDRLSNEGSRCGPCSRVGSPSSSGTVLRSYAIVTRRPEEAIFPALAGLGISATLYGALSRGLLTGSKVGGKSDFREHLPRFTGETGKRNSAAVARFRAFATERGMTPGQLSVAWVLAKQPAFVPMVGARTREQLRDVLGALDKPLSPVDLAAVEAVLPKDSILGARYGLEHMKQLDSES